MKLLVLICSLLGLLVLQIILPLALDFFLSLGLIGVAAYAGYWYAQKE